MRGKAGSNTRWTGYLSELVFSLSSSEGGPTGEGQKGTYAQAAAAHVIPKFEMGKNSVVLRSIPEDTVAISNPDSLHFGKMWVVGDAR